MAYIDDTGEAVRREETLIPATANQPHLVWTFGTSQCVRCPGL